MSVFKLLSLSFVVVTSIWSQVNPFADRRSLAPPIAQNVLSEQSSEKAPQVSASPISTAVPDQISPQPSVKSSSNSYSKINISVDSQSDKASEVIVYPTARTVGGNRYETHDAGETVYKWYKETLGKRSYKIRNNVKTRANEKFKAVLQGVVADTAIKITIDQETKSANTVITIE